MRNMIIPASYLLLKNPEGKYLLARRVNTGFMDGMYGLCAGHVDIGETAIQAMIREAKEEIGIEITEDDLVFAHVVSRNDCSPERVDFFFECEAWKGEPKNMEMDKCDDLIWVDLANLPQNMVPIVKTVFENIKKGSKYTDLNVNKSKS